MAIYVDNAAIPFGRMKMNHLMADSSDELAAVAKALGLKSAWLQNQGQANEHYDVSLSVRKRAIALGALPVRSRDLVEVVRRKRAAAADTPVGVQPYKLVRPRDIMPCPTQRST